MCGRYTSATPPDLIAAYLDTEAPEALLEPSWNVAPTADVYAVVAHDGARHLDAFHWGLVPPWAKDPKVGSRMINARAETLAAKGAFAPAFRRRRCLVPADGFYEWQARPGWKAKQPFFVHHPDGVPFAFAGLWETWRGPGGDGDVLRSCTIVTTAANAAMAPIHDRMPVILPPDAWATWLDREQDDVEVLERLLVPAPPAVTVLRPVSTLVNDVRNDGAELVEEVDPDAPPEGALL